MANNTLSTLAVVLVVVLLAYGGYMAYTTSGPMDASDKLVEEWNAEEEGQINKEVAESIISQHRTLAKAAVSNHAEIDSYYYALATDGACEGAIDFFYEKREGLTDDYYATMAIASAEDPEEECYGVEGDKAILACWKQQTQDEVTQNCVDYMVEEPEVKAGNEEACEGRVGKEWYRCMAAATRNYDKYVNMLLDDYALILLSQEKDKKSICADVNDPHLRNRCETRTDNDVVGEDLTSEMPAEYVERYL